MSKKQKDTRGPKTFLIVGNTFRQPGAGDLEVKTMRKTRWERFVNLVLLPWRYIWHGNFKL